jgi:hypothetical protein
MANIAKTEDIQDRVSREKKIVATDLSDEFGVSPVNFLPRRTTKNPHHYIKHYEI